MVIPFLGILFKTQENKIITSQNETLNYLFFQENKEPKILIYNSQIEEPSYIVLKTDGYVDLKNIKTYEEAVNIVPHIFK